jgi:hypothetical protein
MAFRWKVSALFLVPNSLKDFVDCLDLAMEAQQNLDTSKTIWPTSYKILIHKHGVKMWSYVEYVNIILSLLFIIPYQPKS